MFRVRGSGSASLKDRKRQQQIQRRKQAGNGLQANSMQVRQECSMAPINDKTDRTSKSVCNKNCSTIVDDS